MWLRFLLCVQILRPLEDKEVQLAQLMINYLLNQLQEFKNRVKKFVSDVSSNIKYCIAESTRYSGIQ